MSRLVAAICGLGRIGWAFGRATGGFPLCHAAAYCDRDDVVLAAGCDPSAECRSGFEAAHAGARTFASPEEMLCHVRPDIVSICSPASDHAAQVLACIEAGVPMIWLEKPPACSVREMEALLDAQARQPNCSVLVNYQRRYAPCSEKLRAAYQERTFGRPVRLSALYSRGLAANGSHLLDLAFFVTGDVSECAISWMDSGASASSPCFGLRFADGLEAVFQGDELPYHNIELTLMCEAGRLSLLHGGADTATELRVENPLYPGFFRLAPAERDVLAPAGLDTCMGAALDDLIRCGRAGRAPRSSLATAMRTQRVLHGILGGRA